MRNGMEALAMEYQQGTEDLFATHCLGYMAKAVALRNHAIQHRDPSDCRDHIPGTDDLYRRSTLPQLTITEPPS